MTVGSSWTQDFDVEIPGATGDPLHVVVGINVVGTEKIDGAEVLVIEAQGELNLVDSDMRMKDGQILHVVHGRYEVKGIAKWDIDRGIPPLRRSRADSQGHHGPPEDPTTRKSEQSAGWSLDEVHDPPLASCQSGSLPVR